VRPAELSHFIRQAAAGIHQDIELIESEARLELDHEELVFRFCDQDAPPLRVVITIDPTA
jgi:hypothetical protein